MERKMSRSSTSRTVVLKALLESGPLSRSAVADATGLSRSLISEVSQELLDIGLLLEMPVPHDPQRRGRPSILLSIKSSHAYFVGASISEAEPLMVLTDMHGRVVGEHTMTPAESPPEVVDSMRRGLTSLLRSRAIPREQVLGIGIAMSGFIDHRAGICLHSAALNWHDVPIAEMVHASTRIATYLENDANAVATAEKLFGCAREFDDFSIVTIGRQIGCAHYMQGELQRGHAGGAGEIGHITVEFEGPRCRCGKPGCLDMFAASTAMIEAAKADHLPVTRVREIEALAANGNASAIAILRSAGNALGFAVASLIQINNPELILFEDMEGIGSGLFSTTVRQAIENNILPRFLSSTRLLFHQVERNVLARGAASIAAHQYLLERAVS
ncbi:putative NBD/HSP70 family sugar kinase [Acidipila rosea]|uniref:Putative NBD/HSP70 family sugar kinase n=2 Tax=Acidipila rosea TaxID=768535 RepID=A0A4R1KYJ3_9BACT|nr:putative NBD/HSP70 family sugar kinase [Acidipila rosea]